MEKSTTGVRMEQLNESDIFAKNTWGNSVADKIDATGDCWEWVGPLHGGGYGHKYYRGRFWSTHRLVWSALVGPIPDNMDIDHLCRNRQCCNPDHLEVVTRSTNLLRGIRNGYQKKTHCPHGHEYSNENTFVNVRGSRECRTCRRQKNKQRSTRRY